MRKLVIGMALASTAIASPSLARDGAWYVELNGGPMIVEDIEFDVGAIDNAVTVDTKKGYDFGGIVGYDFGFIRLEAEGSYRSADIDTISASTAVLPVTAARDISGSWTGGGDANVLSFMLNAMADFGP